MKTVLKKIRAVEGEDGIFLYTVKNEGSKLRLEVGPDQIWILDINTAKKMRGKGYATAALRFMFEFAKKKRLIIIPGAYTEDGEIFLRHVIRRLAKIHQVEVLEDQ